MLEAFTMKKKILILTLLSFVSAGLFLAVYFAVKFIKNKMVNKDREKLESYVEKYLHGNEELMKFVGTLSDEQVKELLGILQTIQREQNQKTLKSPAIPKILEQKVTNLI